MRDLPGYALRRASSAAMQKLTRELAPLDLRPSDASVLIVIEANPNITQSEIGRMLEIAGANMAPLVSRLEKRELVDRQPVDGRSHGLALTTAGRALCVRARKIMKSHEADLMAKIPAAQRAAFISMLQALWDSEQ
ncbi:MAG TPA: MarR family transcriptional regulator [Steroidobacteraceae bacterium]